MFVKKVRKKCRVRGCSNVKDVFVISKRREMSNTLIICKECLADALLSIKAYEDTENSKKDVTTSKVGENTEEVENVSAKNNENKDEVFKTSTSTEDVVTSAGKSQPKSAAKKTTKKK